MIKVHVYAENTHQTFIPPTNTYTYKELTMLQALYQVLGQGAGNAAVSEFKKDVILFLWNYQLQKKKIGKKKSDGDCDKSYKRKVGVLREPQGTRMIFGLEKAFWGHLAGLVYRAYDSCFQGCKFKAQLGHRAYLKKENF